MPANRRKPHPIRALFACDRCGCDTRAESYTVKSNVWHEATAGKPINRLCIGCLERRLGRKLRAGDFAEGAYLNDPTRVDISDRLRDRLTRWW